MTTSANNLPGTNGKTMAGIIILAIGSMLLINQLHFFYLPHWLYSWPMWLIAYGLYIGSKNNFRKPVWFWMILIGSAFLITENVADASRFVWPVAIIGMGTWMVLRHHDDQRNNLTGNCS